MGADMGSMVSQIQLLCPPELAFSHVPGQFFVGSAGVPKVHSPACRRLQILPTAWDLLFHPQNSPQVETKGAFCPVIYLG